MDIANYIGELLGRHSELNVPGLGYFVHVRVGAYYNDAERRFYPPGYKIQFDPQTIGDDDTLTQYIAEKKKISLASSKYFTDKYINALKQEASLQEVAFAGLGWFFMDKGKIAFKSRVVNTDSANFYGYAPISIKKLHQTDLPEVSATVNDTYTVAPALPEPADVTVTAAPEPLPLPPPIRLHTSSEPVEQPEEYVDDEPEYKRGMSVWAIVLIIVIVLGMAAFAVYKYKPQWLNLANKEQARLPKKQSPPPIARPDTDTIKKAAVAADSVKQTISKPDSALKTSTVAPADSVSEPTFAIFLVTFKTVAKAEQEVANYKKKGVDARIYAGPGTGKRIKVITGSFATYEEAEAERNRLVKEKKITRDSYSYQLSNHKK